MERTAELDRSQRAQREKQRQDARLKGFNANDYVRPGFVTKDQVMDFKQVFDMIDTDYSNAIDPKEIVEAAKAMSVELDGMAEKSILDLYGGPMSWDVFFDCMTKVLTRGDLARSPQFFALLDEDHTGSISKENLKSAAKKAGSKLKPGELEEMFEVLNTKRGTADDDGELDMLDIMLALEAGVVSSEERAKKAALDEQKRKELEGDSGVGAPY
jgi:Ca2+-binding EF-hand superfamily protein